MLGFILVGSFVFFAIVVLRAANEPRSNKKISRKTDLSLSSETTQPKSINPLYQPDDCCLRDSSERSDLYVSHYLHKLDADRYVILDNLLIPSEHTKSGMTQIDHVIVSTYGIFVIETKGHTGYIFGSKQSKMWTQCKYGGVRSSFNSPTRQNYGHKQAALNVLKGLVFEPIHSLCVFPFASKIIAEDCPNVFDTDEALDYILSQRRRIYSNVEVNRMVNMLLKANKTDDYSYDNHVAELKFHFAN